MTNARRRSNSSKMPNKKLNKKAKVHGPSKSKRWSAKEKCLFTTNLKMSKTQKQKNLNISPTERQWSCSRCLIWRPSRPMMSFRNFLASLTSSTSKCTLQRPFMITKTRRTNSAHSNTLKTNYMAVAKSMPARRRRWTVTSYANSSRRPSSKWPLRASRRSLITISGGYSVRWIK